MNNIFLEQRFLDELKDIFKKTIPNAKILAYGSRVNNTKNNVHSGSDLDLAVIGDGDITALKTALQESNIPFLVDVVQFENLSENFQKEILKNYVEL